jgi:hypothetical protein
LTPLLAAPAPSADAVEPRAATDQSLLQVAFGVLQKHKTGAGGEQYVLVDNDGQVRYSISPGSDLPLEANVGKPVQIVGSFDSPQASQEKPLLVARAIEPKIAPPAQFADLQSLTSADQDSLPPLTPIPPSSGSSTRSSGGSSSGDSAANALPDLIPETEIVEGPLLNSPDGLETGELQPLLPTPDPWHVAPCGPPERIWGQVDALMWWTKELPMPPLVTTSPPGTPQAQAGVIGAQGTQVLFGNEDLFTDPRGGGRLRLGGWLGARRWVGLELDYTVLDDAQTDFLATSVGDQILARPFFNVGENTLSSDSALVAYPNLLVGTIYIDTYSQFETFGVHLLTNILCNFGCRGDEGQGECSRDTGFRLDLIGGYRYIGLDEGVTIREAISTSVTPRTGFQAMDQFATSNDFQGGELGVSARYLRRRWWAEGLLKMALGRTDEQIAIDGYTQLVVPPGAEDGSATLLTGDLLALSTNIGNYSQKTTAWASEVGLTMGYQLTPQLSVKFGYTLLFLSRAIRPDGAIDLNVNEMYIPDPTSPDLVPVGPARPAVAFNDTSYWAQGFNLGLDYRW